MLSRAFRRGLAAILLFLSRRRRRLFTAAEHHPENGEGQLGVILRQLFGLLAQKPALEALVSSRKCV
jgi:hypothetical protein